jgi:hypothetical protein
MSVAETGGWSEWDIRNIGHSDREYTSAAPLATRVVLMIKFFLRRFKVRPGWRHWCDVVWSGEWRGAFERWS